MMVVVSGASSIMTLSVISSMRLLGGILLNTSQQQLRVVLVLGFVMQSANG
jgi:hypothetical protein